MQREKNIVRAKVFGRKDNPTPEIVMQRIRVRLLGKLARRILPIIRKGFAGVGNGTAYNAFMSANMIQVTVDENMNGSIDFEGLKLASGLLYTPRVEVTCEGTPQVYRFVRKKVLPHWTIKYTACCWKRHCNGCVWWR